MKKKWIILPLLLLMVSFIPSVYAFMFEQSQTMVNSYVPAYVACQVAETFDGTNKTDITVANNSNTDVYIRVRLASYWKDSKGNAVARQQQTVSFTPGTNWIQDPHDPYSYYYTQPVPVGASTGDLLADGSKITLAETHLQENGITFTYHQALDIIAEAIQSLPKEAVETSWGVTVNNGKIQSIN